MRFWLKKLSNGNRTTIYRVVVLLLVASSLGACHSKIVQPTTAPPKMAETLVYYAWPGYMPQTVLDAFTAEYGIQVDYQTYGSQKEAIDQIKAGKACDILIMDNDMIPLLVAAGLLAEIDYRNIPNFKNISANFRDLSYDPANKHSIPFNWGTTGLLYRSDLLQHPVTRWADLWDPRYAGKVAVWLLERHLVSVALKTLGYSINSEKPAELEQALQLLLKLKGKAVFVDLDQPSVSPLLTKGQVWIAHGWAYDALTSQQTNQQIHYVLPAEGTILWGDNLVVMANSQHKAAAELFLNFILRPEIGGQIINELYYANANEAARAFVKPEILEDPLVFPSSDDLKNAEIMMPASPTGQKRYDEIWARFMAALKTPDK